MTTIRVMCGAEHDEKEQYSGKMELGIFLDWQKAHSICRRLENDVEDTETSRFAAMQREHDIIDGKRAAQRAQRAKAAARARKL